LNEWINTAMPHEIHLIATIAAAFGFAMLLGLLAARLKLPPLLGYLLAGSVWACTSL
jgi:CPA2 family monovalent cation:H+ antiporter-2